MNELNAITNKYLEAGKQKAPSFKEIVDMINNQNHLQEQLVSANLNELKNAMGKDPELKTFLTTPAKDLPLQYRFLIRELSEDLENVTLFYLIEASIKMHFKGTKTVSYFSKAGDKIVGFTAYIVRGTEVIEIKMFSFNPKRVNPVLFRDLDYLLSDLITKFTKVSWSALKENPANAAYRRANNKYGGNLPYEEDGIIYYCIESN